MCYNKYRKKRKEVKKMRTKREKLVLVEIKNDRTLLSENWVAESEILELTDNEFDELDGFELRFGQSDNSFLVGYNRFDNNTPMYGWIEYNGNKLL